ncbi:type IV toxin-antitoxin system AbiEi family antitoxin [Mycolicibacterium helvum]|uniref:AbiEi antitoxin C-terminal domain-containing protein n=1 Tax=Mycolicibacterium helvum TaxID=1534349 RepID=A0A7I7TAA0_9MYCO|nr:type IV toxin-antitoxin system AbiEi family antitoxin [Mycolicibacterium helvum]BBY65076.1 hypothetical protein MHEL_33190 [Mycolicibacterium helvum]
MSSPFSGSTAIASGLLTRGQLRWNYTAIHPDVYVPKGSERTLDVRTRAAALWVPDGIVAGRAAAALHGASWVGASTPVELIGRARRRQAGVIVREDRIRSDELMPHGDLVVTTPQRTALDLARHLPRAEAVAHLDALAAATGIKPADVLSLADRYPGARGVRRARAVAPLTDPGAQSPRESWLRLLLIDAGYPRPVTQIPVSDGYTTAFVDLGWDEPKIGLEYEGAHHQSDRSQFVRDIGRHDMLEELGWLIVRVVKEHSRAYILRRVHDAFNRRRISLARSA